MGHDADDLGLEVADEEQAELRREIEGLRAALAFKDGTIEDLAVDLIRAEEASR